MKARPGSTFQVANPPAKPLLVYDGDCGFCKLWLARWQEETGGAVESQPLQQAAARFPEVPREEFERAVKLIESDGRVWSSAEAVYRSLGAGGRPLNRWSYDHLPGFAAVSEFAYRFIAGHREFAHRVTRLFWGNDVRKPTYFRARTWFLRLLGVIYLIAFLSFWVQADGLIGARGVLPLPQFLTAARTQLGEHAWLVLPTLCWLNSSNAFLHLLCGVGVVLSALLIAEIAPALCLVLLGALYLSLSVAGQTFFSFQWDILLLETGFLAIFLAPWRWWPRRDRPAPLSRPALFLLQFLLFKLMLMSGVVKLTSGDASWWDLSALDYHYWTQPLPTVVGWWADKSPEWVKQFSTAAVLGIEIIVPFLVWFPRRFRLLGCGLIVLLQVVIGLTGNYAFFNLLTLALCLLLIDDVAWPGRGLTNPEPARQRWQVRVPAVVILLTMPLNALLIGNGFKPDLRWPPALETFSNALSPFRIVNGYGLFRVMTKERPEIILEGSDNGTEWKAYEFKWKPGALDRMPAFVQPHQPRLDWQMWFAALSDVRQNPWFLGLAVRVLKNSPDVVALLGKNPFPDKPPRYLRANIYRYHFSSRAEHAKMGAWWRREDERVYLPVVSVRGE
ncbi:MAG: lipase maturation factor family protein [Chthoniobacterales bacterium]